MSGPPIGRSSREQAEAEKYFYPGTTVLRNKLGITDQGALDNAETIIVADRLGSLAPMKAFAYSEFKRAHVYVFQDLYEWAGQERTYTTGRSAASFAVPEFVGSEMEKRFALIRGDVRILSTDTGEFAAAAAEHVAEINAIHPFLEGNGRITRALLKDLAQRAGHRFSSAAIERSEWYEAARVSFEEQDYAPLAALIRRELERVREENP